MKHLVRSARSMMTMELLIQQHKAAVIYGKQGATNVEPRSR